MFYEYAEQNIKFAERENLNQTNLASGLLQTGKDYLAWSFQADCFK